VLNAVRGVIDSMTFVSITSERVKAFSKTYAGLTITGFNTGITQDNTEEKTNSKKDSDDEKSLRNKPGMRYWTISLSEPNLVNQ